MIVGLGVDLADLGRIGRVHARFGRRFLEKFLAPRELAGLPSEPRLSLLAGRFAAKEAAAKALGTGFSGGIGPCQLEIVIGPSGAPGLVFHGAARERAVQLGARAAHVSISHERSHAVAVVVLEA